MELIDIFYATDAEKKIAHLEAEKLRVRINQLSQDFEVDIRVFRGNGERKKDFHDGEHRYGVYNPPIRKDACSLTITDDAAWTKQGKPVFGFYRGDGEAHIRVHKIREKGPDSVHILIHEWLHYYADKKWSINPDCRDQYEFPGKEHDCEQNGWHFWYTALLGTQKPVRIAPS